MMPGQIILSGTVVDTATSEPLPGATISVNGSPVTAANSSGSFNINVLPTDIVKASFVGYSDLSLQAQDVEAQSGYMELEGLPQSMTPFTVTASAPKTNNDIYYGLAAIGLLLIVSKDNKKVGATKSAAKYILPLAAVAVGAIVVTEMLKKKPITTTVAPGATTTTTTSSVTSGATGILNALSNLFKATGSGPNLTDAQGNALPINPNTNQLEPTDNYTPGSPAAEFPTINPTAPVLQFNPVPVDNSTAEDNFFSEFGDGSVAGIPSNFAMMLSGIGMLMLPGTPRIGATDYSGYILPLALVLGGVLLYEKFFSGSNALNTQNQNQISTANTAAAAATLANTLKTQQPTLTAEALASMANTIFANGQTGNPVPQANQDNIMWQVMDINNLADWYSLVVAFGNKNVSSANWITAALNFSSSSPDTHVDDLPTYLRGVLDAAHLSEVNQYFSDTGINYQL